MSWNVAIAQILKLIQKASKPNQLGFSSSIYVKIVQFSKKELCMKVEQYHFKKPLSPKDENLWNSHWCLIRTHHNYPSKIDFLHSYH